MLHRFQQTVSHLPLPGKFTCPFHYTPHPLCRIATEEVQAYLAQQEEWREELQRGKMFGVLVVSDREGTIGFLAAFSGNIAGTCRHPYFVPPIFDLSGPGGFFRPEEENISAINRQIEALQTDAHYRDCRRRLEEEIREATQTIVATKEVMKAAKAARERRRQANPDDTEKAALIQESQFQKAELKRIERHWKGRIEAIQTEVTAFHTEIERLKTERKTRSAALQLKLFHQFHLRNARGETIDLPLLFEQTAQRIPPAGTGECAAPKLLQYAYLNGLHPLAMAEFWWGDSPKAEIRRHGYFYPACKGKCEPLLKFMLQGLDVEDNPLECSREQEEALDIVYEDAWLLVVNKPAGLLSVPGKGDPDSVYRRIRKLYPQATGPLVVHRLDMATSGLLLAAKTKEAHRDLQAQFSNRTIKKRYVAWLDGVVSQAEGTIDLPLAPDLSDRPRQMVDYEHGKPAITEYKVLRINNGKTYISFRPHTGRTHQLRVHAAHPQGLNASITGDTLYGTQADRLYLHAESLTFRHPVTGEIICVERKDF